jgi:hypothetical protein
MPLRVLRNRTETPNQSGLPNAEIRELMAPVIERIRRRTLRIVAMIATANVALALVLVAGANVDLATFTVLAVGVPTTVVAWFWILRSCKRARVILQRGQSLPAQIVENTIVRGRDRISFEWPSTTVAGRTAYATIKVPHIPSELGPAKVLVHQYGLCLVVNGRAFIAHCG